MTRIIAGTPYIDPTVDHVDLKQLRTFTPAKLRRLQRTQVLRQGDRPVAVLLSFNTFLRIQEELETLSNRVADYEAEDLDPLFGGVAGPFGDTFADPIDGDSETAEEESPTSIDDIRAELEGELPKTS